MAQAAIKQREVDERIVLDDAQVIAVLEKMVKQRKESVVQFEQGGRADLAQKERAEIELLQSYLPAQLSETELDALIRDAIAATGATSMKDMPDWNAAPPPLACLLYDLLGNRARRDVQPRDP